MSRRKLEDRLAEVERMLAEGHSPADAAREAAAKYGVGIRQGQKYVARVFDRWQEDDREMRQFRRVQMRQVAQHLYRECYERERWGTCVSVLTLLCKLDGLFEQRVEVRQRPTTAGRSAYPNYDQMTTAQRRKRLAELVRKATPKPFTTVD